MPIPSNPEPMPRTTAKQRVYATLQQWIVDGTLEPGERLNDVELAAYFSVSRTPVREALQMLAEQKLVNIVPSSGTYVAPIDDDDMVHVYQLLGSLQSLAAAWCIQCVTPEQLDELDVLNDQFWQQMHTGSAAAVYEADSRFHHALCRLAGNPYLTEFCDQLMVQARRNENRFFKQGIRPVESYDAHKRIVQALRAGDLAAAMKEIQDNWTVSIAAEKGGGQE